MLATERFLKKKLGKSLRINGKRMHYYNAGITTVYVSTNTVANAYVYSNIDINMDNAILNAWQRFFRSIDSFEKQLTKIVYKYFPSSSVPAKRIGEPLPNLIFGGLSVQFYYDHSESLDKLRVEFDFGDELWYANLEMKTNYVLPYTPGPAKVKKIRRVEGFDIKSIKMMVGLTAPSKELTEAIVTGPVYDAINSMYNATDEL